ncbi:citrate lyase beta subunit [Punctularia strigosozonata HHB-11173 SS5]|uniref:citrate lyase beta subunit n=1 Tax=Punctularia strigosozonata (strain HHB-11173) TaxID=741275 RepID=UPI0004416F8C|nr:citrate lyase beta subunit [Punctularia strigosozonata HHB-11173 SS5]EIN12833.1 citrate lyase beta subunit [Punctularia strigosozonata HHB-11173 SS5]
MIAGVWAVRPAAASCARLRPIRRISYGRLLTTLSRSQDAPVEHLRRSYLYVPTSSQKMLMKSLTSQTDVIIYDLEDSVSPFDKDTARERLEGFLTDGSIVAKLPQSHRIAVRLNALDTPQFQSDIRQALALPAIGTLVMPKIHSARDLDHVSREIYAASRHHPVSAGVASPIRVVASIESAKGLWSVGDIASWTSEYGPSLGGKLSALLFAAEDFCADTSIVRTRSRSELLYARSRMVIAAKAFGLEAIDMASVCVNYKDKDYLRDECEDGRRLGFTAKQAIHPDQVEVIQTTFVPTEKEILRAAKIVHGMAKAHASQIGAIGLDDGKGGKEMIDAPMLKQAKRIVQIARAAGVRIPDVS